jgi:hypothetical protein
MWDRRIFLKRRHEASFNKDLLNEPNFNWIPLAGQCLEKGSQRMGGGRIFIKTYCSSPFKGTVQRDGSGQNYAHLIDLY